MKRTAILLATTTLLLAGCSSWSGKSTAGNPGGSAYAGEEGSVFDANAGPARPVKPEVYERPTSDLLAPFAPQATLPQAPAPAPAPAP